MISREKEIELFIKGFIKENVPIFGASISNAVISDGLISTFNSLIKNDRKTEKLMGCFGYGQTYLLVSTLNIYCVKGGKKFGLFGDFELEGYSIIPLETLLNVEYKKKGLFEPEHFIVLHTEDESMQIEGGSKEVCVNFARICNALI